MIDLTFSVWCTPRPEGTGDSQTILMLWKCQEKATEPIWPPYLDEHYPEIALPGMKGYFDKLPPRNWMATTTLKHAKTAHWLDRCQ